MPVLGLKAVYLQNPLSITYTILSIVKDVSEIFVESTILRAPSGVGSKIFVYKSEGRLL